VKPVPSIIHVFWNRAVDRTISMFLFGESVSPLCKQRNLIFQIPYLRSVIQRVDTWVVLQIISSMVEMKDYTLISIKAPTIDEHLYICKKGRHALNIQCVCDGNCS
jgi:hypothetical protein